MTEQSDLDSLRAEFNRYTEENKNVGKVLEECEIGMKCAEICGDAADYRAHAHLRSDALREKERIEREIDRLAAQIGYQTAWPRAHRGDDKPAERHRSLMSRFFRRKPQ